MYGTTTSLLANITSLAFHAQPLYNLTHIQTATLAQLVEQRIRNAQVVGSIPTGGSYPATPKPGVAFFIELIL